MQFFIHKNGYNYKEIVEAVKKIIRPFKMKIDVDPMILEYSSDVSESVKQRIETITEQPEFIEIQHEKVLKELADSDYTMLEDCPISSSKKEEFKQYRQLLRDWKPGKEWPSKPEYEKKRKSLWSRIFG